MSFTFSKLISACALVMICFASVSQIQTIWTENFNNGCESGCEASVYTGPNGAWGITNVGTNGLESNQWFVSGAECGMQAGQCGIGCGATNASLHIGSNFFIIDPGAAYLAGGLGFWNVVTSKRAESPVINTTGFVNLQISFNYIENGDGLTDNAQLWIFDGTTWSLLDDMPKTTCCDGSGNSIPCSGTDQGLWSAFSFNLPASTFNNPNVRIGFLWVNNDDEIGTDPSVAIDDIVITGEPLGGGGAPVANFTFSPSNVCVGNQVTFTNNSTNTAGATYLWNFGPNATPANATTAGPHTVVFSAPGLQTVSLTVTNADGSDTYSQDINVVASPVLQISAVDAVCFGTPTGQATVQASGTGPFTYSWSPSGGSNPTANNLFAGNYSVVVSNPQGCSSTATVTVGSPSQITVNGSVTNTDCNVNNGAIVVNATGGVGSYSYAWLPGGATTPALNNLPTGNYQVTVTDANNCSNFANFTVGLNNNFTVSVSPPVSTIEYLESVLLDVTIVPAIPGATYSWTPTAGLSCTDCPNPIASPIVNTTYVVTVTAANGCSQTAFATVNVELPCGEVFMPSIFSPNGDGLNDQLCLMGGCIVSMTYSIYNRWGELVFTSNNQSECWDGSFRGKPAQPGVYAYKMRATLSDGSTKEESGNITLAR